GWGKWEVNPAQVLHKDNTATEWTQLFTNGQLGRYGNGTSPKAGAPATAFVNPARQVMTGPAVATQQPPWYGSFDFDASQGTSGSYALSAALKNLMPTLTVTMAGSTFSGPFTAFPLLSPTNAYSGYASASQNLTATPAWDELSLHPSVYNSYS